MSRSYKKTPGHFDRNPYMKNQANRIVRRVSPFDDVLVSGKSYRKLMCSWNIRDFYWMAPATFEEFVRQNRRYYDEITESVRQSLYREWMKMRTK